MKLGIPYRQNIDEYIDAEGLTLLCSLILVLERNTTDTSGTR